MTERAAPVRPRLPRSVAATDRHGFGDWLADL
jgi:hypothetical protein